MLKKITFLTLGSLAVGLMHYPVFADEEHPMRANLVIRTLNNNIQNLDNLRFGYKFQYQFGFTQNIYAKISADTYTHGRTGYEARLGYTQNVHKFTPFAEAGFTGIPVQNQMQNHLPSYFEYKVGSYYHINSCFSPFIEFDNPILLHRAAIKIGPAFQFNKSFMLRFDYIQRISKSGNAMELKLFYMF